jgi:hypothetical protein
LQINWIIWSCLKFETNVESWIIIVDDDNPAFVVLEHERTDDIFISSRCRRQNVKSENERNQNDYGTKNDIRLENEVYD